MNFHRDPFFLCDKARDKKVMYLEVKVSSEQFKSYVHPDMNYCNRRLSITMYGMSGNACPAGRAPLSRFLSPP